MEKLKFFFQEAGEFLLLFLENLAVIGAVTAVVVSIFLFRGIWRYVPTTGTLPLLSYGVVALFPIDWETVLFPGCDLETLTSSFSVILLGVEVVKSPQSFEEIKNSWEHINSLLAAIILWLSYAYAWDNRVDWILDGPIFLISIVQTIDVIQGQEVTLAIGRKLARLFGGRR